LSAVLQANKQADFPAFRKVSLFISLHIREKIWLLALITAVALDAEGNYLSAHCHHIYCSLISSGSPLSKSDENEFN
jgi:hypothetical protein